MGAMNGTRGNVTFPTGYTAGVHAWTIDYTAEALESTDFGSRGYKEYIPGLLGWGGTYECRLDDTISIYHPGRPAAIATFQAEPGVLYVGDIIITNISLGVAVDGICSAGFTFIGNGHLRIIGRSTTTTSSSTSTSTTSTSTSTTSTSTSTTSTSTSTSTTSTSTSTST